MFVIQSIGAVLLVIVLIKVVVSMLTLNTRKNKIVRNYKKEIVVDVIDLIALTIGVSFSNFVVDGEIGTTLYNAFLALLLVYAGYVAGERRQIIKIIMDFDKKKGE